MSADINYLPTIWGKTHRAMLIHRQNDIYLAPFEIEKVLVSQGVFQVSPSGVTSQVRPIWREDLELLMIENGGNAYLLHLEGLDFTGANLQGLDL